MFIKTIIQISDLANMTKLCEKSTNLVAKFKWARSNIHSPNTICGLCIRLRKQCPGFIAADIKVIKTEEVLLSLRKVYNIDMWRKFWSVIYIKNLDIKEFAIEEIWKKEQKLSE